VIRVVFDTNIFVSALVFGGPPEALLVAATSGAFQLYSSTPLLAELLEVLGGRFSWPAPRLRDLERRLARLWTLVEPSAELAACSDPDDNRVLECAVESRASYIITGDGALLRLDPFQDIRILRAASFLAEHPWDRETAS
jgi:putative PIN family toxin of toxin-antitoxin system